MQQKDILKSSIDDIVFDGRNKNYGAYYLRKVYRKHIKHGAVVGFAALGLLLSGELIASKMVHRDNTLEVKTILMPPPPPESHPPVPPPPPLPPPPPPVRTQIKIVPPKVFEDKDVKEDKVIIPPVVPSNVDISTKDVKGSENGVPLALATEKGTAPPEEPHVIEKPAIKNEIFKFVEQMPQFADGEVAMYKFLRDNIHYPAIARENGIEGKVFITFVVSTDGSISETKVAKGLAGGCSEEALRVIKLMPKWKPGKQNGRTVPVYFTMPVTFQLQ